MHPVYPPLPWLHTPWLRLGVTTVAELGYMSAYPPRRCGITVYISYIFLKIRNEYNNQVDIALNRGSVLNVIMTIHPLTDC